MSDSPAPEPPRGERRERPRPRPQPQRRPLNRAATRAGGPRQPRQPRGDGGVQSTVGEHWWTARWLAALEQLGWSMRSRGGGSPTRGGGNVLRIDVQPGLVTAAVKGSQPKPFRVTIRIEPLTDEEWERVTDALAAQALFAARLLAGEMPPTIEDAFAQAGVTLFPSSAKDLYAGCSCAEWTKPCKHVAAVHNMLGTEFDRDPFLLFWLRGRSRQQIIEALRAKRAAATPAATGAEGAEPSPSELPAEPALPPLHECLATFWQPGPSLNGAQSTVSLPEVPESVLRRLGPPPFWRGEHDVMPVLLDAYRTVSREAYALAHPEKPVVRPQLERPPERPAEPAPARRPPLAPRRNEAAAARQRQPPGATRGPSRCPRVDRATRPR